MPEYASLHQSAHQINEAAEGHNFISAEFNLGKDSRHTDGSLVKIPGTEQWTQVQIAARHRGKEVAVSMWPGLSRVGLQRTCPTCAAIEVACDARSLTFTPGGVPICAGHDLACKLVTVKKEGPTKGRKFYACAKKRGHQCGTFYWAPQEQDAGQAMWPSLDELQRYAQDPDRPQEAFRLLTFRRGMHGRFVLLPAALCADEESQWLLRDAHVLFRRDDGAVLAFVDARNKASDNGVYNRGLWDMQPRSPDPIYEHQPFRDHVLASLHLPVFDRPICEVLLDQRFFNGVGNYLRAEVLDRARVAPFTPAREVLARCGGVYGASGPQDVLDLCRDVCALSVRKRGRVWFNVYRRKYAKHEVDNLGREIWYRRERGPMAGPEVVDGPCKSIFFAKVPHFVDKRDLESTFKKLGSVEKVCFKEDAKYGFVRYKTVEEAVSALEWLKGNKVYGGTLHAKFRRRIRQNSAAPPPETSLPEHAEQLEPAPAPTEIEIGEEEHGSDAEDGAGSEGEASDAEGMMSVREDEMHGGWGGGGGVADMDDVPNEGPQDGDHEEGKDGDGQCSPGNRGGARQAPKSRVAARQAKRKRNGTAAATGSRKRQTPDLADFQDQDSGIFSKSVQALSVKHPPVPVPQEGMHHSTGASVPGLSAPAASTRAGGMRGGKLQLLAQKMNTYGAAYLASGSGLSFAPASEGGSADLIGEVEASSP